MAYTAWSLVAGEQPTTAKWNILGTNDAYFSTFIGTTALAWTVYTPTLTGITIGNGTVSGRWIRYGNLIRCNVQIKLGTTSSVSSNITFTLPANAHAIHTTTVRFPAPLADLWDSSAGANYPGLTQINSTTQATIMGISAAGTNMSSTNLSSIVPFTWATNDSIAVGLFYEAA